MAMQTALWSKTVALAEYTKPFLIESDKSIWDAKKIMQHDSQRWRTWQTYQYTAFPAPQLTDELERVQFIDAEENREFVVTAIKYALGYAISEELEDDNRNIAGFLNKLSKEMGGSFNYAKELYKISPFNNAFTADYISNYTPTAGEAMCQVDHATARSSETYSNSGGSAEMSYDTVWDAVDYFGSEIYNEAGIPVSDSAMCLFCHPKKARLAKKILQSSNEPDTADRNKNVLPDGISIVQSRLLDVGKWFVVGSRFKDYAYFKVRKPPTTKWKGAFENIGKKCRNHMRISVGITDCRFIYGYNIV